MKRTLLIAAVIISCTAPGETEQPNPEPMNYSAELYVGGIEVPWGFDWLPNGDMIVTQRAGSLYLVRDGELLEPAISGLPDDIYAKGQGGFLDVQVHPEYEENGWIYFSYSSSSGEGEGANTAIMRAKLQNNSLVEKEILYKGSPNSTRGQHYGSRIEFDKAGYMYFSIGDRGNRDVNPQDVTRDMGKIYRLNEDGSVPEDNPYVDKEGLDAIYSYGHRNPQGMAMHPETGEIWAHEHGPQGGDELNIIKPALNYGWPVISYGINYDGTEFAEDTAMAGMEQPVTYWDPSIAPSGMTFVTSDTYPDWKGDLLVGSLKFLYLVHVELDGNEVVSRTPVLEGIGRVRSVKQGPDGNIYVGVDGQGIMIIKATPEAE